MKLKCLHCKKAAKVRGCCVNCYARIVYLVRNGVTWGELEAQGRILPKLPAGRKSKGFPSVNVN